MKRLQVLLLFIVVIIAAIFIWWQNGLAAVNPLDKSEKLFVVPKGAGLRTVAYSLKNEELIRDPIVFFLEVKKLNLDGTIQAGDFRLSPSMSTDSIIKTMTHGGAQDIWVTIPEGDRAEEVAAILKDSLPNYSPDWVTALKPHEGYLFPDTYLFPRDANIDTVIAIMTSNFDKKYAEAKRHQTNNLSEKETVNLASIVQREAITPHDMQYVASTLENRLDIGMALGSDVTLEYVLGYQPTEKTWWKKDLNVDDLALQSPYNTRLSAGLPPTPISNPGLVALEAVLNPPQSNYLYYLSDSKGVLHFAVTLDQHNANIKKYGL